MTDELILPHDTEPQVDPRAPQQTETNPMPCKIHMLSDKTFIVEKINAWQYVPQGIFATGHFKGYSGEIDVVISENQVEYIELDFEALKSFIAQEAAEHASPGA